VSGVCVCVCVSAPFSFCLFAQVCGADEATVGRNIWKRYLRKRSHEPGFCCSIDEKTLLSSSIATSCSLFAFIELSWRYFVVRLANMGMRTVVSVVCGILLLVGCLGCVVGVLAEDICWPDGSFCWTRPALRTTWGGLELRVLSLLACE
jgi:hypothetical protein